MNRLFFKLQKEYSISPALRLRDRSFPVRSHSKLAGVLAGALLAALCWSQSTALASEETLRLDLTLDEVKAILTSYETRRNSENGMAVAVTTGVVACDLLLVTGTGLVGLSLCFVALLCYVRLHLEPVIPPKEVKSTETESAPKRTFDLARYSTALSRLRFIDMPREMMFFVAYLGFLEMVKEKRPLAAHDPLHMRCESIAEKIAENSKIDLFGRVKWKVVVIDDAEVNACAFESGHIVVCSALLNLLDDEEVAFVLAHEMGHLKARHCSERISLSRFPHLLKWSMQLLRIFGFDFGSEFLNLLLYPAGIDIASAVVFQLPFSRLHEEEADLIGLSLLNASNMSTNGAVRACDKLAKWENMKSIELQSEVDNEDSSAKEKTETKRSPYSKALDLLRTHPCWESRKKVIEEYLKTNGDQE